jgi:acyl-CoA dehydrogenase
MDFHPTPEQVEIRDLVQKICARFGDEYWLARDKSGAFPEEFYRAVAMLGCSASRCRRNSAAPVSGSAKPP